MIHNQSIVQQGEKIYYRILPELEKKYKTDDYVFIDPDTGKYYVSSNPITAYKKAQQAHPDKTFFSARVGSLYTQWHSLSSPHQV